jgi:peroxiredoxin
VKLEALIQEGARVQNEFGGSTEIRIEGDEVVLQLNPKIGTPFSVNGRKGIISAYDGNTFTVDYNHPVAGKPVVLDLEVLSLAKASTLKAMTLHWRVDHDTSLETAKAEGKPVVLVLYADWCGWSTRLLNETFNDPRIKFLSDQFVWVKVNSDKERDLKEFYEQDGFPMIVLLNSEGEVIRKIDGFRPAARLSEELKATIRQTNDIRAT